ncbi:rhodanese-like domain-containing protein [Facklamia languida]|uniref:Rhodanese domain-containing protein n=1 Tax=Facklamia languida CCUG 37842 TaxID=883113 RepID=H3NHC8_9LACT|nr:rhodanese-like domain-containing protein [Facklamia languida]EHR38183.1 hypothetical protein HMPREF9708_00267 [Facklamia languida CCUG 37842]
MRKAFLNLTKGAMILGTIATLSVSSIYAQDIEVLTGDKLEKMEQDNKQKEKVLVIDVRSAEEYQAGHVKHAINIPLDEFEASLDRLEAYKDFPIITTCNSGKKSSEAAQILLDNGFKDVKNSEGVKEFDYTLYTFESILPDELIKIVEEGNAVIFDAREAKDFEKSALPGAINVSADEPEKALEHVPEDKDALIVTYCYSGNRSAVIAEFLEKEGYTNVKNSLDGTKENDQLPLEEK